MQCWSTVPVGIQHSRQLLRLRSTNAVSDQKSTDLCRSRFRTENEIQSIGGFLAAHPLAGVLSASNLSKKFLETFAA